MRPAGVAASKTIFKTSDELIRVAYTVRTVLRPRTASPQFDRQAAKVPIRPQLNKNRGDWRSFEPLVARFIDAALADALRLVVGLRFVG